MSAELWFEESRDECMDCDFDILYANLDLNGRKVMY